MLGTPSGEAVAMIEGITPSKQAWRSARRSVIETGSWILPAFSPGRLHKDRFDREAQDLRLQIDEPGRRERPIEAEPRERLDHRLDVVLRARSMGGRSWNARGATFELVRDIVGRPREGDSELPVAA